jgi:hypothetical protein
MVRPENLVAETFPVFAVEIRQAGFFERELDGNAQFGVICCLGALLVCARTDLMRINDLHANETHGATMAKTEQQVTVRLPSDLRAFVEGVAEREDRTLANAIRRILAEAARRSQAQHETA